MSEDADERKENSAEEKEGGDERREKLEDAKANTIAGSVAGGTSGVCASTATRAPTANRRRGSATALRARARRDSRAPKSRAATDMHVRADVTIVQCAVVCQLCSVIVLYTRCVDVTELNTISRRHVGGIYLASTKIELNCGQPKDLIPGFFCRPYIIPHTTDC